MIAIALWSVIAASSPAADAHALTEVVAAAAASVAGVQVSTAADLQHVVALQGEKESLNCDASETAACMAELANAFGAPYALTSELGVLGTERTLSLNLLDTKSATSAVRVVLRAADIAALTKKVDDAVPRLLVDWRVNGQLRLLVLDTHDASSSAAGATAATRSEPGATTSALTLAGGVVAGVGALCLGAASVGDVVVAGMQGKLDTNGSRRLDQPAAVALYQQRDGLALATGIGYAAGAVIAVGGAVLFAVGLGSSDDEAPATKARSGE